MSITLQDVIQPVMRVPYSMNIAGIAVTMDLHKTHCVLVEHHDGSIGIVTEKDIVREVVARCKESSQIRAFEIMKQPVITIDHNASIAEAVRTMKVHKIRNLIVTHGDKILGVVKRSRILNGLALNDMEEDGTLWNKPQQQTGHVI